VFVGVGRLALTAEAESAILVGAGAGRVPTTTESFA
jgi:hypothetical protein